MTRYAYTDGRKAVGLSDLDNFLDWLAADGGQDGELSVTAAMRKVAFVARAVKLIADAVRTSPFRLVRLGTDDEYDKGSDWQNLVGFLPNPKHTLELVARSILGPGSAYLFRTLQGRRVIDLRYVAASTITPNIDGVAGVTGFTRKINGQQVDWPAERFVWFWPADDSVEIGPPKTSPVQAALMAAGADYYTSKFVGDFFARGAIKGTLLAVKGNPAEPERKRLKEWFTRTFGRGSASSFGTEIINADALEPVKIGEGLEGLNNSELTREMREDIAVALGVPMSLLLSGTVAGLGGGGVAAQDDIHFYNKTVMPLGEFIADVLNQQVFTPLGLRWDWLWNTLDVFQQDERERAVAFKTYVDARMRPEVAAAMLGLEIPQDADIPPHYAAAFTEEPEPPVMLPGASPATSREEPDEPEETPNPEMQAELAKERELGTRAVDLERWQRKAVKRFEEGKPEKATEFESDAIPATLHAAIVGALSECKTASEVADAFAWVEYP